MTALMGVDIGGTFTDLIFYSEETGEIKVAKESTTPAVPEDGVLATIAAALPDETLDDVRYFLHGTTVGLNSLLTRTGATVGLLTTRGFRDVLEIARGDRGDPYSLFWRQPPALVPRRLRLPVTERVRANGDVVTALNERDIGVALRVFESAGVESIAIAFLNAYSNPQHELAAEKVVRDLGFAGYISLSHRISGEYREYERTSTTVIDAYVRPRMVRYLRVLQARLREMGFSGTPMVTRSGGGVFTFAEAEERPFETIMSGPVAGAEGAAELARMLGLRKVITADVGGTSFDTCMIANGRPGLKYQGEVEGMPVQTPWIDVRSIGAGGGSIAQVDVGGLLRVGPASAGAEPGPACYGRGGTQPTVTDAAFLLGMLGGGTLAGGIVLNASKSDEAISPLAKKLGYSVQQTAQGIMTIAAASMASAIRSITIERGQDPRDALLMPFGGAGPLFATLLSRELDIREIVVPAYAGNFSAWGVLAADLIQTAARTRIMPLTNDALREANAEFATLFKTLASRMPGEHEMVEEIALDIRFVGQEHSLTVSVPEGGQIKSDAHAVRSIFLDAYDRTFGHVISENLEIVCLRATVRGRLPRIGLPSFSVGTSSARNAQIDAWSFSRATQLHFAIVDRSSVSPDGIWGPAIIVEETATTYLDADFMARKGDGGVLRITDLRET